MGAIVPVVVALMIVAIGYGWYVALITRRNKALEALSSIDVQLRKRHDLIPNVLRLAQQFMTHERELITRLTELRTRAQERYDPSRPDDVEAHLSAEGALQGGMRQLFAVAENYPELRSSETIVQAQRTFNEVEGHIAASRRFYNAAVTRLNNAVQIFPGSMIAGMTGIRGMPFFEIEDDVVRQPVNADDYLRAGDRPTV